MSNQSSAFISGRHCRTLWIISFVCLPGGGKNECRSGKHRSITKTGRETEKENRKEDSGPRVKLRNGTVDFVSISYYSSNCVSVTKKGEITAANGGENIKNPYLETSVWGRQIDALLVQKSH